MGRPIEFDKEFVLERAMEVFWIKGYASTSMSDLVNATGMHTRSMYNVFGSKNGVFNAVLQKYHLNGFQLLVSRLKKTEGLEAIREFIKFSTSSSSKNGCLFVNTLSQSHIIEKDCLLIVKRHFQSLETLLRDKLEYAKENEGYKGDPSLTAQQIIIFIQGLAIYSKMESSPKEIGEKFLEQLAI